MKKAPINKPHEWHSSNSKHGMGDYYGTGIKAKVGKSISQMGVSKISERKLGNPPKSLA